MDVGMVGCGGISGIHVNAGRDVGISVAAACDLNEKAAIQFTEGWKIPSHYTSFSEMLKKEELFAVSVCVPPKFHADIAVEALKSGCNVVVERPFTGKQQKEKQDIQRYILKNGI